MAEMEDIGPADVAVLKKSVDELLTVTHKIDAKVDRNSERMTVMETQMTVWKSTVVPMLMSFTGLVVGSILTLFILKG